jgi:hypothetical protein
MTFDRDTQGLLKVPFSESEINTFKESRFWQFILAWMEDRLIFTHNDLEAADVDSTVVAVTGPDGKEKRIKLRGIRHLQGCAEEIRYIMELPDSFLAEMKESKEETPNGK